MSCRQLARAGIFQLGGGFADGVAVVSAKRVRRINAQMPTCGRCGVASDFPFASAFPPNPASAGGMLAIAPGRVGIAVWPSGLSLHAISLLDTAALD